ncbi:MAG: MAG1210 family protein [Oligosphaeraceae bacterium]
MSAEEEARSFSPPEEIAQPVEAYRDRYQLAFYEAAAEEFQRLRTAAQVDEEANRASVKELEETTAQAGSASSTHTMCTFLLGLLVVVAIGGCCAVVAPNLEDVVPSENADACLLWGLLLGIGALVLIFLVVLPWRKRIQERLAQLNARIQELTRLTWQQMEPLNQRYDWDQLPRLIRQVCPMLNFDPYFTAGRMTELIQDFGLPEDFVEENCSVLFTQSGDMRGNPFVFLDVLAQEWGTETYYGHLTIHWRERVRDSEGHSHWVTRSETLTATYTAPKPVYSTRGLLLYGNDAAPTLYFSRSPSSLSQAGDGFLDRMRKKSALKKLKKFAENLDDESQYTMMSNEEFELLFHATDRSDEIQFRLLFTPLAMSQMVNLLKDGKVGYGDDFAFTKMGRINAISARHMSDFSLDTNPQTFATNSIDEAERRFMARAQEYFRQVFFAMAPCLCIPLYQQMQSTRTIYGYKPGETSCSWEQESLANYMGEGYFAHPQSITRNILKVGKVTRTKNAGDVQVTSHGFKGVERRTYVSVWGGDGKCHDVPVDWIEYLPVKRTSSFSLAEQIPTDLAAKVQPLRGEERTNLDEFLEQSGLRRDNAVYRRHIFAWFLPRD